MDIFEIFAISNNYVSRTNQNGVIIEGTSIKLRYSKVSNYILMLSNNVVTSLALFNKYEYYMFVYLDYLLILPFAGNTLIVQIS